MTDKKPKMMPTEKAFVFVKNIEERGYEQGKQSQYTETINLFNKLRNGRFQYNDDVKMTIDMLKDEMTRRLKSQLSKSEGAKE